MVLDSGRRAGRKRGGTKEPVSSRTERKSVVQTKDRNSYVI